MVWQREGRSSFVRPVLLVYFPPHFSLIPVCSLLLFVTFSLIRSLFLSLSPPSPGLMTGWLSGWLTEYPCDYAVCFN